MLGGVREECTCHFCSISSKLQLPGCGCEWPVSLVMCWSTHRAASSCDCIASAFMFDDGDLIDFEPDLLLATAGIAAFKLCNAWLVLLSISCSINVCLLWRLNATIFWQVWLWFSFVWVRPIFLYTLGSHKNYWVMEVNSEVILPVDICIIQVEISPNNENPMNSNDIF